MRSLFGRANEEARSGPPATSSDPSRETGGAALPPNLPGGRALDVEALLFAAMDKAALSMIKVLEDDSKDEYGSPTVSLDLKMKVFDKGQDWLIKRKKLQPEQLMDDGEGIAMLRQMTADPGAMVAQFVENPAFIAALDKAGFVRQPQVARPKGGRLTKADEAANARFKQVRAAHQQVVDDQDDSSLKRMLRQADKGGEDDADA